MRLGAKRIHLSEDFASAVRSFESGLFEQAIAQLRGLLHRDPGDADAGYLLRLIERRLAPNPPAGPTTLIWQVDPSKLWEGEWVRTLFSKCAQTEVIDTKREAMAPRMVVVDNGLSDAKVAYYRRAFESGCRIALVHLSDESFADDTSSYRYCETVVRNYRSEVMAGDARVQFFPLGYKAGFARDGGAPRPVAGRRYLWSFAGDAKKSTRREMLAAMNTLPRGFAHLTEGFGSADSLSTGAYRALLDDTVLVPCPGGWSNLETFRVYEALEAGCIPIVERRIAFDYYNDLLGAHPLPTVSDWTEVREFVSSKTLEDLECLRRSCELWWQAFKRRLRSTLTAKVVNALVSHGMAGG